MALYIASKMKMVDGTRHTWHLMVDPAEAWRGLAGFTPAMESTV